MNAPLEDRAQLRNRVRAAAEDRPGVYRWLGRGGRVLYVGKSVRVRSRLLSYFREDAGKTARMVAEARAVSWEYAPSEFAALLREMRLIRAWRPEYNVQHKRDRRYAFIRVTRERAPRLIAASRPSNDGSRHYGPFARARWLQRAVHELSLATGLRDCAADTPIHFADQTDMFGLDRAPRCIRAETGTCPAPCADLCTEAEYRRRLAMARDFLETKSKRLLRQLSEVGERAAEHLDFEYAARIRDRIGTLEKLWGRLAGFRGRLEKFNLVYPVKGHGGDDRVYLIRRGRVSGELPWPTTPRARRAAVATVRRTFRPRPSDRDPSLGADAAAEALLTIGWFARRADERGRAAAPEEWAAG